MDTQDHREHTKLGMERIIRIATVSGTPGHPGAVAWWPASSTKPIHGCQLVACSHRP